MTPAERMALTVASRNLRLGLSRLDYINLLMRLGVRTIRLHSPSYESITQ